MNRQAILKCPAGTNRRSPFCFEFDGPSSIGPAGEVLDSDAAFTRKPRVFRWPFAKGLIIFAGVMLIEICVDSVESALAAERGGADRVELCAGLGEGGVTPGAGLIKCVRERIDIGLQVMIRPRGGDFLYTDVELSAMREEIWIARDSGADGVVLGCLTPAGDIDLEQMESLIELARPCGVTFHRAFDMCRDPRKALEDLVGLGVERILTSGQEADCVAGSPLIRELQQQSDGRIVVMPGGGVTVVNAQRIVAETGVGEIHLSARSVVESGMAHRNPRCSMGGGAGGGEEYRWKATDEAIVRAVVETFR